MEVDVDCPYCGESISLWIDETGGRSQSYIEDCQVCCKPVQITARRDGDDFEVTALRADGG
jgi:hypothetical protein